MTNRPQRLVPLLGLAVLCAAAPARAQDPAFSVGARVLRADPIGHRGRGLDPGTGFGVDVASVVRPGFTVHVGYSRVSFPGRGAAAGTRRVDSGLDLATTTRYRLGVPVWFRSGALFHEAETHLAGRADGEDDGKTGVGLEWGLGALVRLGRVEVTPGVTYRTYVLREAGGVAHLGAEAGVRLRL